MQAEQSNKPKIYIAGKISGEPINKTTMKFGAAHVKFRDMGYIVLNPLEIVNDWKATWDFAMRKCIAAMMSADECYFLKDWKESKGATIEHDLALKLKMKITYESNGRSKN